MTGILKNIWCPTWHISSKHQRQFLIIFRRTDKRNSTEEFTSLAFFQLKRFGMKSTNVIRHLEGRLQTTKLCIFALECAGIIPNNVILYYVVYGQPLSHRMHLFHSVLGYSLRSTANLELICSIYAHQTASSFLTQSFFLRVITRTLKGSSMVGRRKMRWRKVVPIDMLCAEYMREMQFNDCGGGGSSKNTRLNDDHIRVRRICSVRCFGFGVSCIIIKSSSTWENRKPEPVV